MNGQFEKGEHRSKSTEFQKGFSPWNKGKVGVQQSTRKGLKLSPLSEKTKQKQSLAMSGTNHWNWKNGKPKCSDCGKELTNYGNKKCKLHKGLKGSDSPKWIADRTLVIGRHNRQLHDPEYKQWHRQVLLRDSFKCRIDNENCNGRLEAHHILEWKSHPELRYEINNGITLCHAHHPRKRAEEKRLEPIFQALVSVSKGLQSRQ